MKYNDQLTKIIIILLNNINLLKKENKNFITNMNQIPLILAKDHILYPINELYDPSLALVLNISKNYIPIDDYNSIISILKLYGLKQSLTHDIFYQIIKNIN